ncbi:MAG: class I SAM-dependent methyltransferase [Ketobacter sp.]
MAILYEKTVDGLCYQVRSAGNSRRLYTGDVFHSQYNPNHAATGSVWDLLFLPSQFYAPGEIKRVLLLGVGGGAVIHMLNRFIGPHQVIGVEINATHIQIAKRFFNLKYKNLQWQHANAIEWMTTYDGDPFDMIIDDLYFEQDGEPQRAIEADASWFDVLTEHLTENGLLVMNFVNYKEWRHSAYYNEDFVAQEFQSVYQFATPTCHNAVIALLKKQTETKQLRASLRQWPELNPERKGCRLRYAVKKIA